MSIQSKPYYWVTCDWAECGRSAQDGGEFAAWSDESIAEGEAESDGWLIARSASENPDRHYCWEHSHWNDDEDELIPGPAEVPVENELR